MKNAMGIILTGWRNSRLKELAALRSSSAVPVGGKYRAIDFVLSSMVNSGITNVGILTQYSFRSLVDHLGSGKEWDLDRRYGGLFILPPSMEGDDSGWYRGSADAMYNNLTYLKRSAEEYVVIAQGNGVYNIIFDDIIEYHKSAGADITIVYRDMNDFLPDDLAQLGILKVDESGRVIDLQEKPLHHESKLGSMGIYIISRKLLISLIEECAAHGNYDFVKDILIKKLDSLNIRGFRYEGYWRNMGSVGMYYRCNMELLDPEIRNKMFVANGKIYTKVKDEAPAKYNEEAEVSNSIIGDGCIIEGRVEDSVLFRGVLIKKGASVKKCIIMQGTIIEEGVRLSNVIVDKGAVITMGKELRGEDNWPIIIGKNAYV